MRFSFFSCCTSDVKNESHPRNKNNSYPYRSALVDVIFKNREEFAEIIAQLPADKTKLNSIYDLILMHTLEAEGLIVEIKKKEDEHELRSFTAEYLKLLVNQSIDKINCIFEVYPKESSCVISLEKMLHELVSCSDAKILTNNTAFIANILMRKVEKGIRSIVFNPRKTYFRNSLPAELTPPFPPELRVTYIPPPPKNKTESSNSVWNYTLIEITGIPAFNATRISCTPIATAETQTDKIWYGLFCSLGLEKYKPIMTPEETMTFCKELYVKLGGNASRASEIFNKKKSNLEIVRILLDRAKNNKGGASEYILKVIENLDDNHYMKAALFAEYKRLEEQDKVSTENFRMQDAFFDSVSKAPY